MQTLIVAWPPPLLRVGAHGLLGYPLCQLQDCPLGRGRGVELGVSRLSMRNPSRVGGERGDGSAQGEITREMSVDVVTKHCRLVHLPPERLLPVE